MQRVSTLVVTFSALALSSAAAHAQHQQAVVTCGTPLNALATGSGAWFIAKVGPQPDRTTPPMTTPPATGYVQAVSAVPLNNPPAPPTDPEGYRWDGNMSWISMTPSGASSTNPHHYYVRQQITLDATVVGCRTCGGCQACKDSGMRAAIQRARSHPAVRACCVPDVLSHQSLGVSPGGAYAKRPDLP